MKPSKEEEINGAAIKAITESETRANLSGQGENFFEPTSVLLGRVSGPSMGLRLRNPESTHRRMGSSMCNVADRHGLGY